MTGEAGAPTGGVGGTTFGALSSIGSDLSVSTKTPSRAAASVPPTACAPFAPRAPPPPSASPPP